MASRLFAIYDPKHMNMDALDVLIEKWLRRRGKRIFPSLSDWSRVSTDYRVKFQFGFGQIAQFQKYAFDEFYDKTRVKFFLDESKSTYRDALYELQPHMLKFFLDEVDTYFLPPAYGKPIIVELDEEWWNDWQKKCKEITQEEEDNLFGAAQENLLAIEKERLRKSKRLCVLQREHAPLQPKRRKVEEICVESKRKPRKSNFNCVQWKHLQVQARKQLHEAVLSFDFAYVKLIAKEWEEESAEERRLDVDAIEWAFRRICKQLLPHSAEKETAMRENGIRMIETLFECFSSMSLCKPKCMRLHIINICRDLENRSDIISHMLQYKCSCCLSLQI